MYRLSPFLLTLLVLVPAAVDASCQTVYCQQRSRLWRQENEPKLKQKLLEDPTDRESWNRLLHTLRYKPGRERAIAGYRARWLWEPQPVLDALEAYEARWAAEQAEWLAAYRAALPEEGDGPCRQAEEIEPLEERVLFLQRAADEMADSAEVAGCLAAAWREAGQPAAAVAALETFRDRQPEDRQALGQLISLLRESGRTADWLRALEEQAARFPDDAYAQARLLAAYQELGRVDQREALLEVLWTRFADPGDRYALCTGGSYGAKTDRRWEVECAERLLREGEGDVDFAWRKVLSDRVHRRDWPALLEFVATRPPEQVLATWTWIVDWIDEPRACTELGRFFDAGGFEPALEVEGVAIEPVPELARLLHRCGRAPDGETLLAPWLPRAHPSELGWSRGYRELFIAEVERRLEAAPGDLELVRALLALRRDGGEAEAAEVARLQRRVTEIAPDPRALLELAEMLEAQERWREAEEALARAAERVIDGIPAAPEDLWIRAGAAALSAGDLDRVRGHAFRVLRSPNAFARQRAEAGYLLGRVAVEEGRIDEAIERLEGYFLLRLRYDGCTNEPFCDRGLLFYLMRFARHERLQTYLSRRAEAVAYFREHVQEAVPRLPHDEPQPCPPYPLVEHSPLCAAPPCTLPQNLDVKFLDHRLLRVSWDLRQVD